MHKEDKERLVSELTERLKSSQTLIVADYRGLTNAEIDALRGQLLEQGARFSVVKNTLTRRAAEAAGVDTLLAMLEGPTAIAFLESGGDPAAVAKALADTAKTTRVLAIKGGLLEGRPVSAEEVEALAKLPPADVVRAQLLGAITAPLTTIVALFNAPLQDLVGLIDARVEQLQAEGDTSAAEAEAPAAEPEAPAAEELETSEEAETPVAEAEAAPAPAEETEEAPAAEAGPVTNEETTPEEDTETSDPASEEE
jgi:large subunit ribosomal protein L10